MKRQSTIPFNLIPSIKFNKLNFLFMNSIEWNLMEWNEKYYNSTAAPIIYSCFVQWMKEEWIIVGSTKTTQFVFSFLARRAWAGLFFLRLLLSWLCWWVKGGSSRTATSQQRRRAQPVNQREKRENNWGWFVSVVCSSFSLSCFVFAELMKEMKQNKERREESKQSATPSSPRCAASSSINSPSLLAGALRPSKEWMSCWVVCLLPS